MRLLHTSDWHLGRSLHGVDLLGHQAAYLDHLVELVDAERVDAVLVAGDVYDRAIPPVEAVTLLSETLAQLADRTTVVLTSGNHDSATRLGFGAALMRERVRVRTRVADLATPVELPDDVLVYGLPYLDPDFARAELGGPDGPTARSHEAVVAAALDRVRADAAARRTGVGGAPGRQVHPVVVAHAFVVGGAASESERDIRVGGVDQVPAGVFAGVEYVALGHLHSPQQVSGPDGTVLRYSGSPLAYSFGERAVPKSTVLVELGGASPRTTLVPAPVPRRLSQVRGTLDELLGVAGEPYLDDWLAVTVTDVARPPDLYRRVRERFAHALVVQHEPQGAPTSTRAAAVHEASDPLVVAADFVAHVTGARPDAAETAVLTRAYEDVLAAGASA